MPLNEGVKIKTDKAVAILLVFCALFPLQVVTLLIGNKVGFFLFLISALLVLLIRFDLALKSFFRLRFFCAFVIFGSFVSVFGSPTFDVLVYQNVVACSLIALIVFFAASHTSKIKLIEYMSLVAVFSVFSIALSQFYVFFGGGSNFEVVNPNGLINRWYFLSFSRDNYSGIIRPAWIFDEPGTLSYFLTFVALSREFIGRDRRITSVIIFMGLFTLSLAHLLVCCIYAIYLFFYFYKKSNFFFRIISILLAFAVLAWSGMWAYQNTDEIYASIFFSRIDSEAGFVAGNNRSNQVMDYIENADLGGVILGYPECANSSKVGVCQKFPDQSSNIFTPIFYGGVLLSVPFYVIFIYCCCLMVSYRPPASRILIFILIAVWLQRPYVFEYTYLIMSAMALYGLMAVPLRSNMTICRKKYLR